MPDRTIDEVKNMLIILQSSSECMEYAIKILYRYQKIEQIIKEYKSQHNAEFILEKIEETLSE